MSNRPLSFISSVGEVGFPSPDDDFIGQSLDLNEHLIKHPVATFFMRVEGDEMAQSGISTGDILVVDRSITPETGQTIVVAMNGELVVRILRKDGGRTFLATDNPLVNPVEVTGGIEPIVWGVVSWVIRKRT